MVLRGALELSRNPLGAGAPSLATGRWARKGERDGEERKHNEQVDGWERKKETTMKANQP
eukprot:1654927-Pyramimonas_sp.AAC.1